MTEWFLQKNERIVHKFDSIDIPLYITNNRIVFLQESWGSMNFQDISLKHLSSVKAKKEIKWGLIGIGIIIFGISFLFTMNPYLLGSLPSGVGFFTFMGLIMGIGLILIGLFFGQKEVVFTADSGESIRISIKRKSDMENIIKTVRENE